MERMDPLVISDAHRGLRDAIATVLAGASWQRCRTNFMTNLLTRVPRRAQPAVATMVRAVYQQPSAEEVHTQLHRVIYQLEDRFSQAASVLAEAGPDVLAFTAFPVAHWRQIWPNNPLELLDTHMGNGTPRSSTSFQANRRRRVAGISPLTMIWIPNGLRRLRPR